MLDHGAMASQRFLLALGHHRRSPFEATMREIYYHEDDYCQIELVTEANGNWCADQMGQIEEFASAHRAEVGWTDMYVRSDNPTPLSTLRISRSQFASAMPSSMPPFGRVLTGYSSYREECKRTIAFSPGESLVAFAEFDEKEIISAVWFTFDLRAVDDLVIASELAIALSRWPVLIADWGWSRLLQTSDAETLTQYYNERLTVFGPDKT